MNVKKQSLRMMSLLVAGAALTLGTWRAEACTGVTVTAENGDVVYGRTLEWGSFNLKSRLIFFPRGHVHVAELPKGQGGLKWRGRYGVAGIDALLRHCLLDGMNEKGLAAGLFYHPGFAHYVPLTKENSSRAISPTDVLNYVLSTCQTVDEARRALNYVVVVDVKEEALGFTAPVHIIVTEPGGKQLVVEWLDGRPSFYTPPVGVLTNAPNYEWQITNLRNYVNLSLKPGKDIELGKFKVSPLGGGSGMLGLPGDFTPPSRFVRAAAFCAIARSVPDGQEGIYEVFRMLDNFNVPLGAAEGNKIEKLKGERSATIWTIAHDHSRKIFYYHTQHDRQLQMVDLKRIDFGSFGKVIVFPLDQGHQTVRDRTPNLAAQ